MLKTGIGFNKYGFDDISDPELLALLKSIGFDSFFTGYKDESLGKRGDIYRGIA